MPIMNNVAVPVDDDLEAARVALSRAMARYPYGPISFSFEAMFLSLCAANAAIEAERGTR